MAAALLLGRALGWTRPGGARGARRGAAGPGASPAGEGSGAPGFAAGFGEARLTRGTCV